MAVSLFLLKFVTCSNGSIRSCHFEESSTTTSLWNVMTPPSASFLAQTKSCFNLGNDNGKIRKLQKRLEPMNEFSKALRVLVGNENLLELNPWGQPDQFKSTCWVAGSGQLRDFYLPNQTDPWGQPNPYETTHRVHGSESV